MIWFKFWNVGSPFALTLFQPSVILVRLDKALFYWNERISVSVWIVSRYSLHFRKSLTLNGLINKPKLILLLIKYAYRTIDRPSLTHMDFKAELALLILNINVHPNGRFYSNRSSVVRTGRVYRKRPSAVYLKYKID